jgi:hypothetical protein
VRFEALTVEAFEAPRVVGERVRGKGADPLPLLVVGEIPPGAAGALFRHEVHVERFVERGPDLFTPLLVAQRVGFLHRFDQNAVECFDYVGGSAAVALGKRGAGRKQSKSHSQATRDNQTFVHFRSVLETVRAAQRVRFAVGADRTIARRTSGVDFEPRAGAGSTLAPL